MAKTAKMTRAEKHQALRKIARKMDDALTDLDFPRLARLARQARNIRPAGGPLAARVNDFLCREQAATKAHNRLSNLIGLLHETGEP